MNTDTSQQAKPSDEARADLAPQGKLRLAFPAASALYVTRDPATGELRGVSTDLGAALAERLGVPFEAKPYKAVRELIADTGKGEWDIATIVMEDERRKTFDYSRAYLEANSTYLVPAGSPSRRWPTPTSRAPASGSRKNPPSICFSPALSSRRRWFASAASARHSRG